MLRFIVTAFLVLSACAKEPAPAPPEMPRPPERDEAEEIELGREAAEDLDARLGLYADDDLQGYVEALGLRIAALSERPELPWRFRILDSPVVNAFALPGGFVYVTRGLLAYLDDEASLAGAIGHVVGHVTARHGAERILRQRLAGSEVSAGTVFFPEVRPFGDALGEDVGLLFQRFGRDDEREAQRLGARYALAGGYPPEGMARFLGVVESLGGEDREIPSWASTHPDPGEGRSGILAVAEKGPARADAREGGERAYRQRIEGLVFGDDPREGFLRGNRFLHPGFELVLELPDGWHVRHTRRVLYAAAPDGAAALRLTRSPLAAGATPADHGCGFLDRRKFEHTTGERIRVGPFSAYRTPFRALAPSGEIRGEAGFVADGAFVHELLGYTRSENFRSHSPVFRRILGSFDRLRDRRALEIQPLRIRLFELPEPMTLASAAARSGSDSEHLAVLAILNGLDPGDELPAGKLLKILKRGDSP